MADFPVHPAAELFPMMLDEQYAKLRDDIRANGLREPITLCEAKVLDGRNRLRACDELGIEPKFTSYDGESPVAFVWSLNGARRHLSKSQLAAIATEMLPQLREEASKRKAQATGAPRGEKSVLPVSAGETGNARDIAAKMVGVGHSIVQRAAEVKKTDPALFERIKTGEVTVESAHRNLRHGVPLPDKPQKAPRAERERQIRELAALGNRADQIAEKIGTSVQRVRELANAAGITLPDAAIGRAHKIDAHRVIETTVHGLEGYSLGLQTINGAVNSIDPAVAAQWAESLRASFVSLHKLRKQLLEVANGN